MKPLNLKETALKEEIKEILEELENMYEISELEEQVNNINKIRDYIINLQQENKQLKEKLDCDLQWAFKYDKQLSKWNKLKEYLNYKSERAVGEDEYVYDEIYNEMQELEGSDE